MTDKAKWGKKLGGDGGDRRLVSTIKPVEAPDGDGESISLEENDRHLDPGEIEPDELDDSDGEE